MPYMPVLQITIWSVHNLVAPLNNIRGVLDKGRAAFSKISDQHSRRPDKWQRVLRASEIADSRASTVCTLLTRSVMFYGFRRGLKSRCRLEDQLLR